MILRSRDQRTLFPLLILMTVGLGAAGLSRLGPLGSGSMELAEGRPYRPRIAVNGCDWPELCLLPGINETRARRIVWDRQVHGPFKTPEDLQRISGIGPKTQARLLPWLDFSCPLPTAKVGDTHGPRSLN